MQNIYDIQKWEDYSVSFNFKKNDIVIYNNYFYYALNDHTKTAANFPTTSNENWGGVSIDRNGETKPQFIWKTSYGTRVAVEPRTIINQFGGGYQQRIQDNINSNLIKVQAAFLNRDFAESRAISHFLFIRNGVESFLFTPPAPFNKSKRFICKSFTPVLEFYNNNSIEPEFEEVVN